MYRHTVRLVAAALAAAGVFAMTAVDHTAAASAPAPERPVCTSYEDNLTFPIQRCDGGDAVRLIQYHLRTYTAGLQIDGRFGARTERAVRHFQEISRLTVDGIVGPKTWMALVYPVGLPDVDGSGLVEPDEYPYVPLGSTEPCDQYTETDQYPLDLCDSGPAVRVAQAFLQMRFSASLVTVDGRVGRNTDYVLRIFQQTAGRRIDGLIGPRTWASLTVGFTCGEDRDGSGLIDPYEITSDPSDYASVVDFRSSCGASPMVNG